MKEYVLKNKRFIILMSIGTLITTFLILLVPIIITSIKFGDDEIFDYKLVIIISIVMLVSLFLQYIIIFFREKIAVDINSCKYEDLEENYFDKNFGDKYFGKRDARRIGFIREKIETKKREKEISEKEYNILLSSLIYSIDKIANTVGHYEAYIKKSIKDDVLFFNLIKPLDTKGKNIKIFREEANKLGNKITSDIVFLDPPYNSRQYSRFYHVIENLVEWEKPELFGVALKPKEKNMSDYCRSNAPKVFDDLVKKLNCKYIAVTYNNTYNSKSSSSKNKISFEEISKSLNEVGETKVFEKEYKFFNAGKTDFKAHKEFLFLTEVK